jgi:hypothetical protein
MGKSTSGIMEKWSLEMGIENEEILQRKIDNIQLVVAQNHKLIQTALLELQKIANTLRALEKNKD